MLTGVTPNRVHKTPADDHCPIQTPQVLSWVRSSILTDMTN